MRFEGIASSTGVDREGERMSPRALEAMARSGGVELRDGHRGETIGVVEECRREGERLTVRGSLEDTPRARALWEKLRAGVRLALSVGGRKRVVRRYSVVAGRHVRMIEEARLEHVAVCRPDEARNGETELRVESGARADARKWKVESGEGSLARRGDAPTSPAHVPCADGRGAEGDPPAENQPLPPHPEGEEAGGEAALPGRRRSLRAQRSGRAVGARGDEGNEGRARGESAPYSGHRRDAGATGTGTARQETAMGNNDQLWKGVL